MATFISLLFVIVFILSLSSFISCDRSTYSLDSSYRFQLQSSDAFQCPAADIDKIFPLDYSNRQCLGLSQYTAAKSAVECALACCAMGPDGCSIYQWCDGGLCDSLSSSSLCLIGMANNCSENAAPGWISKGRFSPSPPTPGDVCSDPRCMSDFDDSDWRLVDLPHDFVVEGTFNQTADMGHGYLPYGVGWYRKYFSLPVSLQSSSSIWIDFEGVQTAASIWLNGIVIGRNAFGYTPFRFFLDASMLKFGANVKNLLVVKADATKPDGWWYDGGGIYRHVYLTAVSSPIYLTPDGVYSPSTVNSPISFDQSGQPYADSTVHPSIEVTNPSFSDESFGALFEIFDSSHKLIGSSSLDNQPIAANNTKQFFSSDIFIKQASLWHLVPSPALYWLTVTIKSSSGDVDQLTIRFGIRQTKWDGATGFYLNGQRTKIKGMANHQDFGGLGVAIPDHFQWYRIKKLQEMGANGWRTAHNPPNPALLNAADQLGFLVWDENHRNGQADQMKVLVRRDRNHPSVIIWSLCNEVLCNTNDTVGDAKKLKQIAREIDPLGGRVISANFNDFVGPLTPLDVQGFDYHTYQYDEWHAQAPNIPSISSETSSAVSDRDEYTNDPITAHVSGYDLNYPDWGQSAEQAWGGVGEPNGQGILTRDFIAGGWIWTGFDYKGEPTPYSWPNINSHFGIIDIAGFPKDRYYWYYAWFHANYHNKTAIYVFPHWNNWTPGQIVNVWVYSNGEEIELKLNGQSLGRKSMQKYSHVEWNVTYQPGVIEAIAYRTGSSVPIVSMHRNTTGSPSRIKLSVEFSSPSSTVFSSCAHSEIALISASIIDSVGQTVHTASNQIEFLVKGAGKIVGTANGDPSSHTADKSHIRSAYHGLASLLIQPEGQVGETLLVQAVSEGLESGEIELTLKEADAVAKEWWCKNYPILY